MKNVVRALLLLIVMNSSQLLSARSFQTVNNHLRVGYTFFSFEESTGHMMEIGFYNRHTYADNKFRDFMYASKGFSFSMAGLITDNKFYPGIKAGYEADFLVFSGKIDVSLLGPYLSISPMVGLTIRGKLNIMAGYNACITKDKKNGYFLTAYVNFLNKPKLTFLDRFDWTSPWENG